MSLSAAQVANFVSEAKERGSVWAIRDDKGYPAPMNAEGERAMPFWSSKSRIEKLAKQAPAYRPFEPQEIELDRWLDWLIDLEKDGLKIGLNWYGKRATGWHLSVPDVRAKFGRVEKTGMPDKVGSTSTSSSPPKGSKFWAWLTSKASAR